jgi:Fe-S cluster assembly protein SufD
MTAPADTTDSVETQGGAADVATPGATAGGPLTARPHSHGDTKRSGTPAERFTSRNPDDFAVPAGREEDWQFTPIRRIREFFQPLTVTGALIGSTTAPAGVVIGELPISDPRVGRSIAPADRVSALAWSGSKNAFVVNIPANSEMAEPIFISALGQPGVTYAHLVIASGANSQATVVVDYSGSVKVAENVEIVVGDGARLTVISIQDWAPDAIHLSATHALVGRDGTLRHISVTLGGAVVRSVPTVRFAGPGGTAELFGLAFAETGQHHESRLYVDHSMPNCTSNVMYKTALSGQTARTVWIGDVRIRPAATGTQTYELNRNLLLSDGARADSVPNLEIETGEIISAGHASATGRFDDLQLFYLQSRGIPEDEARRLVVRGFFAEVLDMIEIPQLHERLLGAVEARLGLAASEES